MNKIDSEFAFNLTWIIDCLTWVLAVIYIGRVVEVAWFREPTTKVIRPPGKEMIAVTWLLALATTYFGIDTDLNGDLAREAAKALLAGYGGADGG